mmetsp:Transcript_20035/g.40842  ORF Transcript_20035/g.40842 Transcript_20035/m.40842 type:complete len:264 (-) Transcript_20035:81-872(-)|eukprot:CAMPEP_0119058716 /NCGR_PEP_ID=MMETSP1178-20130426/2986_1 /TAXON_ID=33656 /ORGANISM="unid sp, Strain CCMP2000" /LENGTH=263 /DNA_ID=CAMNT_0007039687 /DNA_START=116 /DNA_END=907 /DNA_ORIENTATION=-
MPVSHAAYCAAHEALHELEDVRRLAEDHDQQLSYDALLCIFSKKQQDLVKRTAGRHRHNAANYVERYQQGESLEAIAKAVQLPPTMLARIVLEELCDLKKGKEVGALLKEPHRLADARMRREVQRAVATDVCYGPGVDTVRHLIGLEYEAVLEQRLRDLGAPHQTEGEARQSGSFKTPDALLPVPLVVGGRAVHWIDSKATFGDLASHAEYSSHQFSAYLNRFDSGLVIYWFGFVDQVATLDPRILVLDHFPQDCRLMQGSYP